MSAGLPGAGLGALLYLVLVLILPLRVLVKGRGGADRRSALRQFAIVSAMVFTAAIETEFALWLGFMPASKLVRFIPALALGALVTALEIGRFRIRVRRHLINRTIPDV